MQFDLLTGGFNMPYRVTMVLTLLVALALPLLWAVDAGAIPAFTRQHKTECSTCHTLYPELNEYGQAFLKNGYVYSEKKKGENVEPAPTGKEETGRAGAGKNEKNEGIRLSGIPELLPLSITAN